MQFIQHGPDIPERLLQAQEEGRVVFFCGAGISYPARLPGFSDLVSGIYQEIGEQPNNIERSAIKAKQFDTTIGLLESRIMDGRDMVRRTVAKILTPELGARHAMATHEALLTLAHCRNGRTRLITTNFDRLFEEVIARNALNIPRFQAPLLPVPKNRWDGLVYLHGLLPSVLSASELDRLVLSSGDFGLAYLTERWAARFVSELFRNYTVCFVGYSINDPVLRYMMDALAADRLLGESPPEMFAFGSHIKGKEQKAAEEWQAKNVTPVLYRELNNHAYLHKTIRAWADTYRDGVQGKERIVVEYAMNRPSTSTRQDDFVGRMLWALSDPSGLPAKRFAGDPSFDQTPSLDWLEALSEDRFRHVDLVRLGVPPLPKTNAKLMFSLLHRPAPYTHSPWMMLTTGNAGNSNWDNVMSHLALWLVRHLNDPALVLWLAQHGGQLHDQFVWLVESELDRFSKLEREGDIAELDRIRANAPNAIPQPLMRTVWRLLISGRVKSPWRDPDIYRWKARLNRDGMTATLRLELRELLEPKITLKKPFHWETDDAEASEAANLKQLVNWELALATDHVHSSLSDLQQSAIWQAALPTLIVDFQQLLRDALDLLSELGEADDLNDRSHWDLSSISPHWQNRGFRDWVSLIELLRDAWLAVFQSTPARATQIAQDWFSQPYPTFKRLALFAASQVGSVTSDEWVNWLLADECWWLWSGDTQRETMRLLVLQGAHLSTYARERLETAILAGPPSKIYLDKIEPERWQALVSHSIWLHLAKLASSGGALGADAAEKLVELTETNPDWRLATNERDEFSHWMSGTGDPDYEDQRQIDRAPRTRRDLIAWLQRQPAKVFFYENDWRNVCQEKFATAVCALFALAKDDIWPTEHWREALQSWSEDKWIRRSWRYIAPLMAHMPDKILASIVHSATWWLEAASKKLERHEDLFFDLCRRFLTMQNEDGVLEDRPVTRAINHPVGHVTRALLNIWLRREPSDSDGLPDDVKPLFTLLCSKQMEQYRHGRVLLASHLIALFRVDQTWAEQYLLPELSWQRSESEARATWEGFLWSPRLYRPLLTVFKNNFLETARHYNDLGDHSRQYAAILTHAALEANDIFTNAEMHAATSALPPEGLQESAQALVYALEGASEQREQYWLNRILPYWRAVWPKSKQLASKSIAEKLALLAIAARGEFPTALATVHGWLQPLEYPHYLVTRLQEAGLCATFPQDVLSLLNAIIDNQSWPGPELDECLKAISQAWPEGKRDPRYQRLEQFQRR